MKYYQIINIFNQTGLSPEDLSVRLGVGSMTIRRWQAHLDRDVPKRYRVIVIEGIHQLLIDGLLNSESAEVSSVLASAPNLAFKAVLKQLNVSVDEMAMSPDCHQDLVWMVLSKIGMNVRYQNIVNMKRSHVESFKKMGKQWKSIIQSLIKVLDSKQIRGIDKVIAYGALFYLLMPIDLIPDYIPGIGLVDDFGILGFAVAFYNSRFLSILGKV